MPVKAEGAAMSVLSGRLGAMFGREVPGLLGLFALTVVAFGLASPQFLTAANFDSIAFQLPDLGLLTLAMLAPIMSGGINLAIIATENPWRVRASNTCQTMAATTNRIIGTGMARILP